LQNAASISGLLLTTEALVTEVVPDILAKAGARTSDVASFGAGIFVSQPAAQKLSDASKLDWKRGLDLARYAALPLSRAPGETIQFFTSDTAIRLLYAQ
jgi:hypothetical protein